MNDVIQYQKYEEVNQKQFDYKVNRTVAEVAQMFMRKQQDILQDNP